MFANVVVSGIYPDPDNSNNACFSARFAATDDPRFGQISVCVDMNQTVDQIKLAIRQGVVDYINQERGSTVIVVSEVTLV